MDKIIWIVLEIALSFTAGWIVCNAVFNLRNRNNEVYIIPKDVVEQMTEYMEDLYERHEESQEDNEDRDFVNLMKKFEDN